METLKLTYFDFPGGRGEDCRLALHIAGVDWEDDRVRGDWADRKPNTPFGSLPTLEVPGRGTLSQSNAILTYIGRAYGLLPDDPFEAARHEAILCAVEEMRAEAQTTLKDDEDEKKAAREAYAAGYLARWLPNVEAQIEGPLISGNELSVADLKLFIALGSYRKGVYDYISTDVLAPYPKINALLDAVAADARVAVWYAAS